MYQKAFWFQMALNVLHTGSRVICNPPPTNTDDDYLLLLDIRSVSTLERELQRNNFTLGGSFKFHKLNPLVEFPDLYCTGNNKSSIFHSWKNDDLNLILTCSLEYYTNFAKATLLAKEMNLTDKEKRIQLFELICYDSYSYYDEVLLKEDEPTGI